ncbi:hypothetical protein JTE90_021798 [Oedothorax gibbosus]|uniref:CCHC-type domain-containing protein n=1 Tax=Oedothorax gibbosus TaxID=931172 RepID=A0AAV6TP83_9ARAC|nr:hypothetical protein JTE90_021798 [Oedothorax gibbosus]
MAELRSAPVYRKHNPGTQAPVSCPLLKEFISSLKSKVIPNENTVEGAILDLCINLQKFMTTYIKTQLSYGTQNVLVGEFIGPLIEMALSNSNSRLGSPRTSTPASQRSYSLSDSDRKKTQLNLDAANREIVKLRDLIQANIDKATINDHTARDKITELENEVKLLHQAQSNFLNNAVNLREAQGTLEKAYHARNLELDETATKNQALLEGTYQDKLKILEDLRIERTNAAQKDEIHRQELMETMRNQFTKMFDEEGKHLDRVLKRSTEGITEQSNVLTQQIKQIGSIEEKLAASITTLNHDISTISHPLPIPSSSAPLPASPQDLPSDQNRFDGIFVVLVDKPSSSPLSLDSFQTRLSQASLEAKIPFRCNGTFTTKTGFKISIPTEEDQDIVADLLRSSPSLQDLKFKIPRKVKPQYIIKFTSITGAEDFATDLVARNPFISRDTFKVVFSMKAKVDIHWIIETEQQYTYLFKPLFNVFVGLKRCTIKDFISINHCKKCGKYGHTKKRCTSTTTICLNCGQQEHDPTQECVT